jgi:hypothetical protein
LREQHRLRVCENRIIRRIFGPKRDVVTGEWMKYTVRSFIFLTHPQNIIRQIKSKNMRWVGHVARMGEERKVYKDLVRNPKGKIPFTRPGCRWEDGVRMECSEIGSG